jgi:hypothetical protein
VGPGEGQPPQTGARREALVGKPSAAYPLLSVRIVRERYDFRGASLSSCCLCVQTLGSEQGKRRLSGALKWSVVHAILSHNGHKSRRTAP